jgi:hypothetical protein
MMMRDPGATRNDDTPRIDSSESAVMMLRRMSLGSRTASVGKPESLSQVKLPQVARRPLTGRQVSYGEH